MNDHSDQHTALLLISKHTHAHTHTHTHTHFISVRLQAVCRAGWLQTLCLHQIFSLTFSNSKHLGTRCTAQCSQCYWAQQLNEHIDRPCQRVTHFTSTHQQQCSCVCVCVCVCVSVSVCVCVCVCVCVMHVEPLIIQYCLIWHLFTQVWDNSNYVKRWKLNRSPVSSLIIRDVGIATSCAGELAVWCECLMEQRDSPQWLRIHWSLHCDRG